MEVIAKRYSDADLSRRYSLYRPTYPTDLFMRIVDYYEEGRGPHCNYQLAVDVGCGNGQGTLPLAEHFHRVIGCDISIQQISHAPSDVDRVKFKVCPSEDLAFLEANSVDLLTSAMSFHFFDRDVFYKEATRVLKPGGVLAIYMYVLDMFDDEEGQTLFYDMMEEFQKSYRHIRVKDYLDMFFNYTLPFPDSKRIACDPSMCNRQKWSLSRLLNFIKSLATWNIYIQENPESNYLEKVEESNCYVEEDLAERYLLYRPGYSSNLFKYLIDYYQEGRGPDCSYQLAVDVGCGNGQATLPLAEYFHRVIGCDISSQQIARAPKDVDKVEFRVSPSENLSFLEPNSVDMLTVATAFHFFNQEKIYEEAKRVLKPGGVLSIYTYSLEMFDDKDGQKLYNEHIENMLKEYWHLSIKDYKILYESYNLPFPNWTRTFNNHSISHRITWSLSQLIGFVTSFHSSYLYAKDFPQSKHLEQIKERFAQLYNCKNREDEPLIGVTIPVYLLIGRKPVTGS